MMKKKSDNPEAVDDLGAAAANARDQAGMPPVRRRRDSNTLTIPREEEEESLEVSPMPDALGEILVNQGLISRHQLFNALNESYRTGCSFSDAILSLGYLTDDALKKVLKGQAIKK